MSNYPYGYGDVTLTWDEMMTKRTVYNLHPEVQRRLKALIEFAAESGVPLGVGTGWRVQPINKPGFAAPGNSWHESCPVNPVSATALAIDTVPNTSWNWMHMHCGKFGFKHFTYVNNEPWHIQPVEIPTSRRFATTLPALTIFNLPGGVGEVPAPIPPQPVPPSTTEPYDLNLVKNTLTPDNRAAMTGNGDVYLVQQISIGWFDQSGNSDLDCGKPDGDYGPRTQQAVRTMQAVCGLTVDAQCGPKTWAGIHVTTPKYTLTDAKRAQLQGNPAVYLIQQIAKGHYRQIGNEAYNCGKPDGDYGPRSQEAVRQLQRDGGLEADAQCGPRTWSYVLNKQGV